MVRRGSALFLMLGALGHNRRSISYQAVSVWVFFLVVIKILSLTCQRHMVSIRGWSGQSFPPPLAPEATSIFSNNDIFAVVHFNYITTGPMGHVRGQPGNSLTAIITMGFTSERAPHAWLFGGGVTDGLTTQPQTEESDTSGSFTSMSPEGCG